MSSLAEEKRFTYKDYATWDNADGRFELIDGHAYAMASPSPQHQGASVELSRQLANFSKGKPCKVFTALDVRLNANTFDDIVVQPDILVVCDRSKIDDKSIIGTPDLVIEILSPSNRENDTKRKPVLYQRVGVREYWIVDPFMNVVYVYILNGEKFNRSIIYREDDIVPVHVLEGCQINLSEVFAEDLEY